MSLPKPYYEHAGITIYHADCRDILPHLPKVDLVLTDPPYGIGESAGKNKSRSKVAIARDYGNLSWDDAPICQSIINQLISFGKKAVVWGGHYYALPPSPSWLVWDKRNTGDFADCELAWSNHGMAVRKIEHLWNGMIRQDQEQRYHPTQKPLKVMSWCLSFFPNAESVLDPFMGSGTTLVAAKLQGKRAIGIEREEKYCEIAVQRLGQDSLFSEESA